MPPSNLYDICVKKTCHFLISGVWEKCEENPFSFVPSSIVQDLQSVILHDGQSGRSRIAQSHLLLSSNMLENVDLFNVKFIGDYIFLFQMLSRGCQNLRRLSLPNYGGIKCDWKRRHSKQALRGLLHNCGKLEELHSNIYFNPNYLRKCRNLRRLELHLGDDALIDFFRHITPGLLQCLPLLEVFSFLYPFQYKTVVSKSIISAIVMILENCPNLTSLGFLDTSVAMKELHERGWIITPHRFQLRRCYWITGKFLDPSVYSDMIRLAALSCPLLQVLVMDVHDAGSLQHLKVLKHLTFLDIKIYTCSKGYYPELYSLIHKIAGQLQFLSITVVGSEEGAFDVNMLIGNCLNLKTLQLDCEITANELVRPSAKLRHLESLEVFSCDRNGLFCLLSNCPNLRLLRVDICKSLDDELLRVILENKYFTELEDVNIFCCNLSKSGITKFLKTSRKLRKFSSGILYNDVLLRQVRKLNPSVSFYLPENYLQPDKQYFFRTLWL